MIIKNKTLIKGVVIKQLNPYYDERGYFEEIIRVTDDFFKEGFGQWSHSIMHQNVIKAWHIHKTQVDWWYIARGTVKAALYDARDNSPTRAIINEFIMGDSGDNIVIKIPPGVAHGVKVLQGPAELFYITSKTYNPDEEGRIPYNDHSINYDWLKPAPRK